MALLFGVLQMARTPLQRDSVCSVVCISTPQCFIYSLLPVPANQNRRGGEKWTLECHVFRVQWSVNSFVTKLDGKAVLVRAVL